MQVFMNKPLHNSSLLDNTSPSDDDDDNDNEDEGARKEKKRTRGPTRKEGKRKNWQIPTSRDHLCSITNDQYYQSTL